MTAVVTEPKRETEFEVQAMLYTELRSLGFNVRGEVPAVWNVKPLRKCRFDLAEFVDGKMVGIIEVKSAPITHRTAQGWNGTRQGYRYSRWGVPVAVVYGMKQAQMLVAQATETGAIFAESSE
jgi:hypothetical protein